MNSHSPSSAEASTLPASSANSKQRGGTPLNAPKDGEFTVTVYAASSTVVAESYVTAAVQLGRAMARKGWIQVNGGGNGLMGACTTGATEAGGTVDCVILNQFVPNMSAGPFRNAKFLDSMILRRAGLYTCANAFVALPGGLGTLEELAEVISWRQLEYHNRVVVMLNVDGFYDSLWRFLQRGIDEGFIAKGVSHCLKIAPTVEDAVRIIEDYKPMPVRMTHGLTGKADWIPSTNGNEKDHENKTPTS